MSRSVIKAHPRPYPGTVVERDLQTRLSHSPFQRGHEQECHSHLSIAERVKRER
jgi:hypothetical protein